MCVTAAVWLTQLYGYSLDGCRLKTVRDPINHWQIGGLGAFQFETVRLLMARLCDDWGKYNGQQSISEAGCRENELDMGIRRRAPTV